MNQILAIDPGTTQSGWVLYIDGKIEGSGILDNPSMLEMVEEHGGWPHAHLAVEMVASFGMPVGAEVFRTVWWAGRFADRYMTQRGRLPIEVFRKDVKLHLCGTAKAKDKNIRQALIDRYGGEGGKEAAVGRKASPGPLYGVRSHVWPALAVAITADETVLCEQERAA